MGIRSILSKPLASFVVKRQEKWSSNPGTTQDKIFNKIVEKATKTAFGKDHDFGRISNYEDFKNRVPIRTYEELKPYVERILAGEKDVLWPGKPAYFAKTSGTTFVTKYIPIT